MSYTELAELAKRTAPAVQYNTTFTHNAARRCRSKCVQQVQCSTTSHITLPTCTVRLLARCFLPPITDSSLFTGPPAPPLPLLLRTAFTNNLLPYPALHCLKPGEGMHGTARIRLQTCPIEMPDGHIRQRTYQTDMMPDSENILPQYCTFYCQST